MPTELNRTGDFKNGNPVTLPKNFGNPVTITPTTTEPEPAPIGTGNPVILPLAGNPVTWTPDPAHFGNSE